MADDDLIGYKPPGFDIMEELRKKQLIQDLTQAQAQQAQPQTQTQPQTAPAQVPGQIPEGQQVPAKITPWEQPQSQFNPAQQGQGQFNPQFSAINQGIQDISQTGTQLANLKQPVPPNVSKLRAALLMPLQVLAGAGGIDTSKEFGSLIRPGYTTAMSDYQRKLSALQTKYGLQKDVFKARLDALKEEGIIDKDQAEAAYRKAEEQFKVQELGIRKQEAENAKAGIAPLNQRIALARQEAEYQNRPFTGKDLDDAVTSYQKAYEQPRIDGENAKWLAEQKARDAQVKAGRETTSVNQLIAADRRRLDKAMEPEARTLQAINQLEASLNNKDLDGFGKTMDVILADSAMAGAGRGITRQNLGIIKELIGSPGIAEQIKGWWQGLTQPGKGTIPEATIRQIRKRVAETKGAVQDQVGYIQDHMDQLDAVDPVDSEARDQANSAMKGFYSGMTKSVPTPSPPEKSDDKAGDKANQIKDLEKKLSDVDAAIKRKLGKK